MEMVNLFKRLHVGCTLHSLLVIGLLAPLYIPLVGFIYSGEWTRGDLGGPEEGWLRSRRTGSIYLKVRVFCWRQSVPPGIEGGCAAVRRRAERLAHPPGYLFFVRIVFVAFLRLRELGGLDDLFAGIGTPHEIRK